MTINPIDNPSNHTLGHKKSDSPAENQTKNADMRVTTAARAALKMGETIMAIPASKEASLASHAANKKQSLFNDLDAIISWKDGSKYQKSAPENPCPV